MKTARLQILGYIIAPTLLGGCHRQRTSYVGFPIGDFRAGAYAALAGNHNDTLRVSATAENASNQNRVDGFGGGCGEVNRLSIVVRRESRVWDSRKWEIARQPVFHDATGRSLAIICGGVELMRTIPPGGLVKYELRIPVTEILGDSLAPGRYTVTGRITINGREIKNLRAGEVELSLP